MKLTVYYDGQYWVGVAEQQDESGLRACKHIFGAEPKDGEVLDFVLHKVCALLQAVKRQAHIKTPADKRVNPKRLARIVADEMRTKGISTFAQEAMKLEHEARKMERKAMSREKLEEYERQKRLIKIQKAKQKHRGR